MWWISSLLARIQFVLSVFHNPSPIIGMVSNLRFCEMVESLVGPYGRYHSLWFHLLEGNSGFFLFFSQPWELLYLSLHHGLEPPQLSHFLLRSWLIQGIGYKGSTITDSDHNRFLISYLHIIDFIIPEGIPEGKRNCGYSGFLYKMMTYLHINCHPCTLNHSQVIILQYLKWYKCINRCHTVYSGNKDNIKQSGHVQCRHMPILFNLRLVENGRWWYRKLLWPLKIQLCMCVCVCMPPAFVIACDISLPSPGTTDMLNHA